MRHCLYRKLHWGPAWAKAIFHGFHENGAFIELPQGRIKWIGIKWIGGFADEADHFELKLGMFVGSVNQEQSEDDIRLTEANWGEDS